MCETSGPGEHTGAISYSLICVSQEEGTGPK